MDVNISLCDRCNKVAAYSHQTGKGNGYVSMNIAEYPYKVCADCAGEIRKSIKEYPHKIEFTPGILMTAVMGTIQEQE